MTSTGPFTAFIGQRRLASGALADVALAIRKNTKPSGNQPILIFDDQSGRSIDVDLRGTGEEARARPPLAEPVTEPSASEPRGRGRPKLGVVAREVTLLPRHWDWLSSQPGGASVALRKLVESARQANRGQDARRKAQESAYRFLAAMAGNEPGFEEAIRALFGNKPQRLNEMIAAWPDDIRDHIVRLAFSDRNDRSAA